MNVETAKNTALIVFTIIESLEKRNEETALITANLPSHPNKNLNIILTIFSNVGKKLIRIATIMIIMVAETYAGNVFSLSSNPTHSVCNHSKLITSSNKIYYNVYPPPSCQYIKRSTVSYGNYPFFRRLEYPWRIID